MPIDDAITLMKAYARLGIKHWKGAAGPLKKRAQDVLGAGGFAQNEAETDNAIDTLKGAKRRELFIPMPKLFHRGVEQCFFLPLKQGDQTAFDLLLLCKDDRCLGFRFEPAQQGTHAYAHIQMNRIMVRGKLQVACLPDWLPDSYPAFPLRTTDPSEMFLSMVTSIHGYDKGMRDVLQEAFVSKPAVWKAYLDQLAKYLTA